MLHVGRRVPRWLCTTAAQYQHHLKLTWPEVSALRLSSPRRWTQPSAIPLAMGPVVCHGFWSSPSRCSSHQGPSSYSTWHHQCEELSPHTSPRSMCPPVPFYYRHFLSLVSQTSTTKQNKKTQNQTTTTTNPRNLVPTSPEATSAAFPRVPTSTLQRCLWCPTSCSSA